MSFEENTYQEIDRFILGEMTEVERTAFQARIEAEPELKEAVELGKAVNRVIRPDGRSELKERLKQIDREGQAEEDHFSHDHNERSKRKFPWLAVAASILLLIAPLALFQLYNSGSSPGEMVNLAIAEAQPDLNRGGIDDPLIDQSLAAFKSGDFAQAEKTLLAYEAQVLTESIKSSVWEYHGLLLLRQDRPDEAESFLQRVALNAPQYSERYWLLSLSLYQQGKTQPCIQALNKYIDENQDRTDDTSQGHVRIARELISEIQQD